MMVLWKTDAKKADSAPANADFSGLLKSIGLLLLLLLFMYLVFTNSGFIKGLVSGYGLLGLFLASIIANATVLLPMPIDLLFLALSAETLTLPDVLVVAIVLGAGAAIGEMTAYITGTLGSKAIKSLGISEFGKIEEIKDRIGENGMYFIFFGALVPFPFDLIGIAAGIVRYDWKKFFIAALLGKTGRYLLIGIAGYFGFTAIKAIFRLG
ncbi:SNARE associated Golgi protein [uncultured archaeon]|nr:SNARE associated Golgi protein [uncultured archaeon]